MSFAKSKNKRFNDAIGCAPPVGSYDPEIKSDSNKGPVSFDKSDRFKVLKDITTMPNTSTPFSFMTPKKMLNMSQCSTESTSKSVKKPSKPFNMDSSKINDLEKEIKGLLQERKELLKDVARKEDEYTKIESKLQTATREKSCLNANIASLVKELKSLRKGNEVLKTKISTMENNGIKRNEYAKELGQLKESLVNNSHEIDDLKEKLKMAKVEFGEKVKECLAKEDELVVAQSQWEDSRSEIDEANAIIDDLTSKNVSLSDQICDLCSELNTMETRLTELQDFNNKLQKDRQMYTNEMEDMRDKHSTEVHDFLTRMSDLDSENKQMHSAFNELKLKNELFVQEQELLRQDKACSIVLQEYKNSLEKRIVAQKETILDLEKEQEKNKQVIRNLKNDVQALQMALNSQEQAMFESNAEKAELVETVSLLKSNECSLNGKMEAITDKCAELEEMLEFERNTNKQQEDSLDKQLEMAKSSIDAANKEISHLGTINKDILSQLNSERSLSESSMNEVSELKGLLEERSGELSAKTKDFDELWTISQQKDKDLEEMHKCKEMCAEEIDCLRDEINAMQEKLSCANQELEMIRKSLVKKEDEYLQVVEERERMRVKVDVGENEKLHTKEKLLELNEGIVSLGKIIFVEDQDNWDVVDADDNKFVDGIQCKISLFEDRLTKYSESNKKVVDELSEDKSKLQAIIKESREKLDDLTKQLCEVNKEKEENQSQISVLKEAECQWKDEKEVMTTMLVELEEKSSYNEGFNSKLSSFQFESDEFKKELENLSRCLKDSEAREQVLRDELINVKKDECSELDALQKRISEVQLEIQEKEILHRSEMTTMEESYKNQILELEERVEKSNLATALEADVNKWKTLYEELNEKILPFREQLDMFALEKDQLMSQNTEAKLNLVALSEKYATLLGHHNQKQKIKHVLKLKQDNLNLKHELAKTKELNARQKRQLMIVEERFVSGDVKRRSNNHLMGKENFPKPLTPSENIRRGLNAARKSVSHSDISRKTNSQDPPRVSTNYGLL